MEQAGSNLGWDIKRFREGYVVCLCVCSHVCGVVQAQDGLGKPAEKHAASNYLCGEERGKEKCEAGVRDGRGDK